MKYIEIDLFSRSDDLIDMRIQSDTFKLLCSCLDESVLLRMGRFVADVFTTTDFNEIKIGSMLGGDMVLISHEGMIMIKIISNNINKNNKSDLLNINIIDEDINLLYRAILDRLDE